jgi:hypothetical protein
MDLTPEERAQLEAEWAKGKKWGAALVRRKALATVVSSAVFGAFLVPAILLLSPRLFALALLVGLPLGMLVRKKLMPRGQFRH